jgi:hypothetical protein
MDGLLILVAILVSAAVTGMFLVAIWKHLAVPSTAGLSSGRRVLVAGCCVAPLLAVPPLVVADLSNAATFGVIAAVTFGAIGLGVLVMIRR